MSFQITIQSGSQVYRLNVEHTPGERFELFKIYNPMNPCNYVVLQSNRPLLRYILKLKHKPIDWIVKEGVVRNSKNLELAQKEIEVWVEQQGM